MNRIHKVLTLATLCGVAAVQAQNLITNPGFESGGTGWTLWTQSGSPAVAAVTYPTGGAHGGTRYARVQVTAPAASAAENWHIQFQPPPSWEAIAGATYEMKFWAKSDSSKPIHVSVQGGDYAYLTGQSFGLTPDWTEYSISHVAAEGGTSSVRFHVYVAEAVDVYSFDDFTLLKTADPVGVRPGASAKEGFRVRQEAGKLVVTLDGAPETWKAELVDLRGTVLANASGRADGLLSFALPKNGAYFVRASTATKAWVRKISVQ
jgi:hypothetical protein